MSTISLRVNLLLVCYLIIAIGCAPGERSNGNQPSLGVTGGEAEGAEQPPSESVSIEWVELVDTAGGKRESSANLYRLVNESEQSYSYWGFSGGDPLVVVQVRDGDGWVDVNTGFVCANMLVRYELEPGGVVEFLTPRTGIESRSGVSLTLSAKGVESQQMLWSPPRNGGSTTQH